MKYDSKSKIKNSTKYKLLCAAMLVLLLSGVAYAEQVSQEEVRQTLKLSLIDYFKNPSKSTLNAAENRELLQAYAESSNNGNLEISNKNIRSSELVNKFRTSRRYKLCIEIYDPVCGLKDGKEITYSNKCKASLDGARIIKKGACSDDGSVCAAVYDPVCGVDKKTYSNSCEAEKANVRVDYKGECKTSVCAAVFDPVCGLKDNEKITYGNSCEAKLDGAKVLYNSQCSKDNSKVCAAVYFPVCGTVMEKEKSRKTFSNECEAEKAGAVDILKGACSDDGSVCAAVFDPVCGVDKKTYGNKCEAEKANVRVDYKGECKKNPAPSPEFDCKNSGGTWKQFANTCGDSCSSVVNPGSACGQAFTYGCDCGSSMCSRDNKCVENPMILN